MLALALAVALIAQPAAAEPLGRAADGRVFAEVMIEGRGPWPFIVDTGASHTAIADVLAAEFGYVPTGETYGVQTLTEAITSERVALDRMEAAGLTVGPIEPVVVATPTDLDLHVFGLLGADMFAGRTIALDLAEATLTAGAGSPDHIDARIDQTLGVPIGQVFIRSLRKPVMAMIDTGSPRTIINSVLAQRLRSDAVPMSFDVMGASRLARTERDADAARVRYFRIGGVCDRSLVAARADVDVFRALGRMDRPAMIVGVDALAGAVITLDHASGAVEISPADGPRCTS